MLRKGRLVHVFGMAASLALSALLVSGVYVGVAAPGPPQAVFPETTHDFGEVFEDKELKHTFILENKGPKPLEILEVDPDCACTVADYDRTVPPGGKGKVTLGIKPYSVVRQFQKNTRIRLSDPNQPEVVLVMKGMGRPIIEIKPSHIVRFRGKAGEALKAEVRFTSHLSVPWEITNTQTNIPDRIEINLKEEKKGKEYVLEIRNKSTQPGNYAGRIDLATTSQKRPRLIVRVFGEIYPEGARVP